MTRKKNTAAAQTAGSSQHQTRSRANSLSLGFDLIPKPQPSGGSSKDAPTPRRGASRPAKANATSAMKERAASRPRGANAKLKAKEQNIGTQRVPLAPSVSSQPKPRPKPKKRKGTKAPPPPEPVDEQEAMEEEKLEAEDNADDEGGPCNDDDDQDLYVQDVDDDGKCHPHERPLFDRPPPAGAANGPRPTPHKTPRAADLFSEHVVFEDATPQPSIPAAPTPQRLASLAQSTHLVPDFATPTRATSTPKPTSGVVGRQDSASRRATPKAATQIDLGPGHSFSQATYMRIQQERHGVHPNRTAAPPRKADSKRERADDSDGISTTSHSAMKKQRTKSKDAPSHSTSSKPGKRKRSNSDSEHEANSNNEEHRAAEEGSEEEEDQEEEGERERDRNRGGDKHPIHKGPGKDKQKRVVIEVESSDDDDSLSDSDIRVSLDSRALLKKIQSDLIKSVLDEATDTALQYSIFSGGYLTTPEARAAQYAVLLGGCTLVGTDANRVAERINIDKAYHTAVPGKRGGKKPKLAPSEYADRDYAKQLLLWIAPKLNRPRVEAPPAVREAVTTHYSLGSISVQAKTNLCTKLNWIFAEDPDQPGKQDPSAAFRHPAILRVFSWFFDARAGPALAKPYIDHFGTRDPIMLSSGETVQYAPPPALLATCAAVAYGHILASLPPSVTDELAATNKVKVSKTGSNVLRDLTVNAFTRAKNFALSTVKVMKDARVRQQCGVPSTSAGPLECEALVDRADEMWTFFAEQVKSWHDEPSAELVSKEDGDEEPLQGHEFMLDMMNFSKFTNTK